MKNLKVAIVYDRVNKWGGAERVLLSLHELFPNAALFTSVYDSKKAPWAKVFPEIKTSFLQKIPFAKSNHELFALLMPFAFEQFDFSDYDTVISVTSEAAKGIKTDGKILHICYCLTPTRYLWSHYDEYFRNPQIKLLTKPLTNLLKKWDKKAARRPDIFVSISGAVKDRIKKYYSRDSKIIFPPVELGNLGRLGKLGRSKKYYLLVSRLDYGYKKVELAIEAFNKLGKPLVIVGKGREERRLKSIAKRNIKFAGQVSEKKLAEYYKNAKALIMPQEEDFGIVAIEAQSYGIPVIAYKRGGSIDTVTPGRTGILFEEQKPRSLIKAIEKFEKMKFSVRNMQINAKRFSKNVFKTAILELISKYNTI